MNKKWIWVALTLAVIAFSWGITHTIRQPPSPDESKPITTSKGDSYWTCPMHPQIHSENPGECPVCHMKLVMVNGEVDHNHAQEGDAHAPVVASNYQLQLAGVQKYEVEKMDLDVHIPIAGRFISPSAVAFQIYESDLHDIKPGLSFRGESSFHPEEDLSGVISSVDSIVDPTSRTVRVVGSVRKGPKGIISETSFRGDILIGLKDRIAIPENSVLQTGKGALVYIVDSNNHLTPKYVKLGSKTDSFFEVIDGLAVGDFISSGPNFLIDSESRLRGVSSGSDTSDEKVKHPTCPKGQHWDIPMAMCMPRSG